jgi:hypothetical protein
LTARTHPPILIGVPPGGARSACSGGARRSATCPAEIVAKAHRENGVILSGKFGGSTVAYLRTDRDLGVVLDMFSRTREGLA